MMKQLYNTGIQSYALAIRIASLFNDKAKMWVEGRQNWKEKVLSIPAKTGKRYWFHCASLGEFEQGRPVMEALKEKDPSIELIVSFFSPSGYRYRKDYELATAVLYLPIDTASNASHWIENLQIDTAFFIKYEFWNYYIKELSNKNIPLYIISANFRKDQIYFKKRGGFYRSILNNVSHIFVQNQSSIALLNEIGIEHCSISGDTRFDKVLQNAKKAREVEELKPFLASASKLVVMGSSWPTEEALMMNYLKESTSPLFKLIIAPHQIDESHIVEIEKSIPEHTSFCRYSDRLNHDLSTINVLIIDNIGMLSNLYQYATIAFIGGGFSGSLHNILEAATFELPVLYGPNFEKFPEGRMLIDAKGGFEVTEQTFSAVLNQLLIDTNFSGIAAKNARNFIENNAGATNIIVETVYSREGMF